ncbi:MAG: MBL fold metallo-hydrolase [Alphaproteobacteria bacterium]|nr:MBL fold metallo-hydrolase [Alphaproteobacteria bacterium]
MAITNRDSGTTIDEIVDGVYRIATPIDDGLGGFSFNQYLVMDDEPLLFHTGPRRLFPLVREAVETVTPAASLRHIAFSHVEADECGSLNEWLAAAPEATPLCGQIAAMVSINDLADRAPRAMADGESISIGRRSIRWIDAPHMPHAWECGFIFDELTKTLFCGDLFTQPGAKHAPLVETDILGPSEAYRKQLDYFSHTRDTDALIARLAATAPKTLACMHGSAWRGDGAALLRALGQSLKS